MNGHRQLELVLGEQPQNKRLQWDEAPDLLTPPEVASLVRISRTSCYESLRSGALKPIAVRWGRRYLIPKAALRHLVEGGDGDA